MNTARKAPSGVSAKGSLAKKVGIFVLGLCICVMVGVGVGVLIYSIRNKDDNIGIDSEQIIETAMEDIVPMSVGESISYLDGKIREYKNTDVVPRLIIMKMNVYVNAGRPEDAIEVASEAREDDLDTNGKMQYYMVLNKAYRALGDNETANYYRDNYFVLYDELYDGGGGSDE